MFWPQEFDDCQDLAGKPIPGWFFRKLMPPVVLIAMHDRAPQLRVSEDRLSVTGDRGYCMVRGTHGAHLGSYYYEVIVSDMPEGSAARIGWSQELGNLQGPCGYDRFSYSWRSRKGTAFHDSRGKHFSDDGFRQGDVLGFLIYLPADSFSPDRAASPDQETEEKCANRESYLPPTHKERPLVKFKSYFYFEQKDEAAKVSKSLRPLFGSQMICYKNGEEMGTMFSDVNAGTYYPAASLYKNITLTFNFGPNFRHRPDLPSIALPSITSCKAVQELADESSVLQSLSDILYFTEKSDSLKVTDLINSFATHG